MAPHRPAPPPPRDPGLQPERTALAWHRTGISGTLVGSVAALTALRFASTGLFALTAAIAAVVAALSGVAATRPQSDLQHRLPSPWWRLLAAAGVVVLVAVSGLLVALVS